MTENGTPIFDFQSLLEKSLDNVPCEYKSAAGTFIGTVKGCADYFEHSHNESARKFLLDQIQISEDVLNTPGLMLNIKTLLEIENVFDDFNLSKKSMEELSLYLNLTDPKRKDVIKQISEYKTDFEAVKKMAEIANNHYDKNFKYRVEKYQDRFKVIARGNEEIHDTLRSKKLTGDRFALFRANTISNSTLEITGKKMDLLEVINNFKSGAQEIEFIFKETRQPLQ